jgi:hypothetical protein
VLPLDDPALADAFGLVAELSELLDVDAFAPEDGFAAELPMAGLVAEVPEALFGIAGDVIPLPL